MSEHVKPQQDPRLIPTHTSSTGSKSHSGTGLISGGLSISKETRCYPACIKQYSKPSTVLRNTSTASLLSNKPFDRESEYTSPGISADGTGKLATRIRIDSVELYGGPKFLYLFDYGDEWWHNVELLSVTERVIRSNYPRVVKKQGKSPPQYSSEGC